MNQEYDFKVTLSIRSKTFERVIIVKSLQTKLFM